VKELVHARTWIPFISYLALSQTKATLPVVNAGDAPAKPPSAGSRDERGKMMAR